MFNLQKRQYASTITHVVAFFFFFFSKGKLNWLFFFFFFPCAWQIKDVEQKGQAMFS